LGLDFHGRGLVCDISAATVAAQSRIPQGHCGLGNQRVRPSVALALVLVRLAGLGTSEFCLLYLYVRADRVSVLVCSNRSFIRPLDAFWCSEVVIAASLVSLHYVCALLAEANDRSEFSWKEEFLVRLGFRYGCWR
jgi:hypothetical protein